MSAPAVLDPPAAPADGWVGEGTDEEPMTLSPALSARVRRELAASEFANVDALLRAALNLRQIVLREGNRPPVIRDPDRRGIPLAEVMRDLDEKYGFLEEEGLVGPDEVDG